MKRRFDPNRIALVAITIPATALAAALGDYTTRLAHCAPTWDPPGAIAPAGLPIVEVPPAARITGVTYADGRPVDDLTQRLVDSIPPPAPSQEPPLDRHLRHPESHPELDADPGPLAAEAEAEPHKELLRRLRLAEHQIALGLAELRGVIADAEEGRLP